MIETEMAFAAAATFGGIAAAAGARGAFRLDRLRLSLQLQRERGFRVVSHDLMSASRRSPIEVVRILDAAVREHCPSVDASLFYRKRLDEYVCLSAAGPRAHVFSGSRIAFDDTSSPIVRAGLARHHLYELEPPAPLIPGDRSYVSFPLVELGSVEAVYYLSSRSSDLNGLFRSVGPIVDLSASAYRLAVERADDRIDATHDGLTGLLTPRAFRRRLAERVTCGRTPLHLLFLDTDHFKACNDTLGHATGDLILRTIAQTIALEAGPNAIVARNGGDEFSVVIEGPFKSRAV
jgi:GGDEF domain-containing protein